jgi:hypothetical protein
MVATYIPCLGTFPAPTMRKSGALFFPSLHEYLPALKVLTCTKEKVIHSTQPFPERAAYPQQSKL